MTDAAGLTMGMRWTALDAVGLYVPGGKAAYPSSVLMNAIPARAAGVGRIAMCVPTPDGVLNPLVLAAARRAGVTEIYRVGGAQAVAALAYGTATIAPVDRIVGPGNAYVAEAKRQVFGRVGIDSIAGPSEVVVLADADNDPRRIAVDLLAQAEHDEAAQSILITNDAAFADAVAAAVWPNFPLCPERRSRARAGRPTARSSWWRIGPRPFAGRPARTGASATDAARSRRVVRSGPARRGGVPGSASAPRRSGDYVAGPNHVLPTGRTARFASGLSVFDFLKRTTFVSTTQAALDAGRAGGRGAGGGRRVAGARSQHRAAAGR